MAVIPGWNQLIWLEQLNSLNVKSLYLKYLIMLWRWQDGCHSGLELADPAETANPP